MTTIPRSWLLLLIVSILCSKQFVSAGYYNNDDYYGADDDNNNKDDDGGGDDDDNNQVDDGNYGGDDGYYGGDDDYYGDDDNGNNYEGDDNYDGDGDGNWDDMFTNNLGDDDLFHWNENVGFDGVSIMPVSCVNYNNGHMIKFELFDTENSYQCHFAQVGTFVVSIAHYMRAYFNYEALVKGQDFNLPGDAGYLNCVMLHETAYGDTPLYAKIGCMERETFTSTKLALHVYTDASCSEPFEDGESARRHSTKGYEINGYSFSSRVSFRPPFYTCQSCTPDDVSATFNKQSGQWYDDDYISRNGNRYQDSEEEEEEEEEEEDDDGNGDDDGNYDDDGNGDDNADDDYYRDDDGNDDDGNGDDGNGDDGNGDDNVDDAYYRTNDDIYNNNNNNQNRNAYYKYYQDYNGYYGNRGLTENEPRILQAAPGQLEAYENDFWEEHNKDRKLYEENYSIDGWNMCQRLYKYGVWCDEDCRGLDAFRTDRWSGADIILLSIMTTFLAAMMLLIVAKRLKASQKSRVYGEDIHMPGLPPAAMAVIFAAVMTVIIVLAKLKFVNETLVFAVVICILLFIYMLKLTLFDSRKPVLLAAPRHEIFDNPLDERLYD